MENPTNNTADLQAQIAQLTAENAKLKVAKGAKLGLKVSQKGAVSLYGLGRFPVTLYKGQWDKLLGMVPEIKAFIDANVDKLTVKEAPAKTEETKETKEAKEA